MSTPKIHRVTIPSSPRCIDKLGLRIKLGDGEDNPIVIYYIEDESEAKHVKLLDNDGGVGEGSSSLVGCEILGVNDHRLLGSNRSVDHVGKMMMFYIAKNGKVNLLVSSGERPTGSIYLVPKNIKIKVSDVEKNIFFKGGSRVGGNTFDDLELEERKEGLGVRVVSSENAVAVAPKTSNKKKGFFNGLRIREGDCIYAIDGHPINSIDDVRKALREATRKKHNLVPILSYNAYRRLKSVVMTTHMLVGLSRSFDWENKLDNGVRNIQDVYDVHEKLGEGAFAVVKRVTHKETGKPFAVKIVNRRSLSKSVETALQLEISILKELNHDHIMQLDNVVVTINNYYLVAEYLEGGELFDRIVQKSSYTESEARDTCKILFGALSYMNSKGIAHRDLKPENLLLQYKDSDSEIKIADFGFAKKTAGDSLKTLCGTPGYVAPEVLSKVPYGTKADMWAMGVIIFIMLGGYPPFYAESPRELLKLTKKGEFEFDPEYWKDISYGVKDLICALLTTDPNKRASADDILGHQWMVEDKEKLMGASLSHTQKELKKYLARMRFKKAIHSVVFVNTFTGSNAVFSDRNRQKQIKTLEDECAKLDREF